MTTNRYLMSRYTGLPAGVIICFMISARVFGMQSATALALESFDYPAGALNTLNGGFGWAGPWQVQNGSVNIPGYNVTTTHPLNYPGLNQSAGFAIGGDSYQSSGRLLDTSAGGALSSYLVNQQVGLPGTTLFAGVLMRKDVETEDPVSITLHPGNPPWWVNTPAIAVGYFGANSDAGGTRYWSLQVAGGAVQQTEVPVVVGQAVLLVLQISFAANNTVLLYVNPPPDSLPGTPDSQISTPNSIVFQSVAFYGGSGANQSSIDEIRFAASYSALISGLPPPLATPQNLSAAAANGSVTLTWNAVPGATAYQIYQVVSGVAELQAVVPANTFVVSGLNNLTAYTFYVVASAGSDASPPSAQTTAVPRGPAPPPRPALGTNLTQVADYNREWPFVDAFKTARPWISQQQGSSWGQGPPLQLDSHGWITSLQPGAYAETIMYDNAIANQADYPVGRYTLLYDGSGTLSFDLQSATIVSQTPGAMIVDVPSGLNGIYLIESATDPTNPIGNIRFILPGFENTYQTQPFHPLFLQRLQGYTVLRYMEWMITNGSIVQNWSDRATPSDYTYCWRGVPIEVLIQLANALKANPWFNIPAMATDDYVNQFAALVNQTLNPDLSFYVEYSNETWNSSFSQAAYVQAQGAALGFGNDPTTSAADYTAYRSVQIFKQFRNVTGTPGRMIRVIASEASNSWLSNQTLQFQNAFASADVLAIAPYFNCSDTPTGGFGVLGDPSTANQVGAMTVDQINTIQLAHINNCALQEMQSNAAVAGSYGLKMVAYEGGQSLVGYNGSQNNVAMTTLFEESNRSSGMGSLYGQYLQNWVTIGGDLFVHYTDMGAYSNTGCFGALEYQDQDPSLSPKYTSLMSFAGQYP